MLRIKLGFHNIKCQAVRLGRSAAVKGSHRSQGDRGLIPTVKHKTCKMLAQAIPIVTAKPNLQFPVLIAGSYGATKGMDGY